MAIVRPKEKRCAAIRIMANLRSQTKELLASADAIQATLESLELELGLATESEINVRSTYVVVHVPRNETQGHPLSECTESCAAEETMLDIDGEEGEGEEVGEEEEKIG